ncbi:MAG: SH3 domain-containing protein [Notoacmeibacter sp.]|nr:SH3 domain-containing protein [Notoacmeibacter sp.]
MAIKRFPGWAWIVAAVMGYSVISGREIDQSSRAVMPRNPISVTPSPEVQDQQPIAPLFAKPEAQKIVRQSEEPYPRPVSVLHTTTRLRVRAEPNTASAIVTVLESGTKVRTVETSGKWHRVSTGIQEGWVHGDYLTSERPKAEPAAKASAPLPVPLVSKPVQNRASKVRQTAAGEPIRSPYVGRCDCPYDRMRNGRRCGGNSAYSKPGGRNPICYR